MRTIGLLGGMSWESSIEYYRIINDTVRDRLGGLHSAESVMYSVDFAVIEMLQHAERWAEATALLIDAAQAVERSGSDFLVICTNTMHRMAEDIAASIKIPLLHIADATAQRIHDAGVARVGLLGTRFTMEGAFYRDRLVAQHGLDVLLPAPVDRQLVHRVIYEELVVGKIEPASRAEYKRIIGQLAQQGAEAVILGCTEISLLVDQTDSPVPLFDTTRIHAETAVDWALSETLAADAGD